MGADNVHADQQASQGSTLAYMRAAKRWIVWAPDKQPFYLDGTPRRGALDTPEDVAKLGTFNDACRVVSDSNGRFAGVGFALGPDELGGHWQGVDFDKIDARQLNDLANTAPGYLEVSPSGTGLHAIGYGTPFSALGSNDTGIEAYSAGRYFTFTGQQLRDAALTDLAPWVQQVLAPRHQRRHGAAGATSGAGSVYVDPKTVAELRSALAHLRADDRDIWVAVGQALKELGEVGRGLWIEWSQTSDKWKATDAKKWDSFDGDRTGYQAVFAKAQAAGWVNPASKAAQSVTQATITKEQGASKIQFRLLSDTDLQSLPPQRWLVKGIIPDSGIGTLFGDSGTFKSFVQLDLLAHISNGRDWFGYRVKPAPCVYVPFEGKGGIPRRVAAWRLAMTKLAHPNLLVCAGPTEDITTNMRFITDPMNLRNPADRDMLCETLTKCRWAGGVLCIDTLAQAGGGIDENSSEGMGQMIEIFQELQRNLGGVVNVVHHTGKDASRGMRGHSSLRGALDFAIECRRVDGADKYRAQLVLDKVKDGEDGRVIDFSMERVFLGQDEDGDDVTSLVVAQPALDAPTDLNVLPTETERDADDETFIWSWVKQEVETGEYPSISSLCAQLNEMKEQRPITQKRVRDAIHRLKARSALVTAPDKSPSGNAWLRAQDMPVQK